MYVHRNIAARSFNHYCTGRAIRIAYSECVFAALVIHHAMRMRHIVALEWPSPQHYVHFLLNGKILSVKKLLNVKRVLIFILFFLKYFSFHKELSQMLSGMCTGLHVKQRIFWDFNEIWIPSKDTQISLLFKILLDGADLLQSDGQTWRM